MSSLGETGGPRNSVLRDECRRHGWGIRGGWLRLAVDLSLPAILLAILCARVWNIGIMHTDDAVWALAAWQPGNDVVVDFARSQGRLWAFPSGLMMLHALAWQNSAYTELLRFGGFTVFLVLFQFAAGAYCGRRIALLSAGLFLAFFALSWDGSILNAYPNMSWVAGAFSMASLLLGKAYFERGGRGFLIAAGLCMFASLFTSEGWALMSAALFPLALITNVIEASGLRKVWFEFTRPTRSRRLLIVYGLAVLVFLCLAVGWAKLQSAQYAGQSIAPIDITRIATVLVSFATSGSILHDFVSPYVVNFSDAVAGGGTRAVYAPSDFAGGLFWPFKAIVVGVIAAAMILRALIAAPSAAPRHRPLVSGLFAVVAGLTVAALPLLPVAATAKYQAWYFDLGVRAYSQGLLGAFGVSLCLAGVISMVLPARFARGRRPGAVLAILLALGVGAVAAVADRMNDAIALDMRSEGGRWRVLALALEANQASQTDAGAIWAPRFASGSWFTVVPTSYWSDYSKARYGADVRFVDRPFQGASTGDTVFLDYTLADDERTFFVTLARLRAGSGKALAPVANRIVIAVERPNELRLRRQVLTYTDADGTIRQVKLRDMKPVDKLGRIWALDNVSADPASIRLLSQTAVTDVPVTCAALPSSGTLIRLGQRAGTGSCLGTALLTSGWGAPERDGVWTLGPKATLKLPLATLPPGDVNLVFDVSTYVGLGFHAGPQSVQVEVKGQRLATWTFARGDGASEARLVIPAALRGADQQLDLVFNIDPPLNPSRLGQSPDNRDLGMYLRSVRLGSAP